MTACYLKYISLPPLLLGKFALPGPRVVSLEACDLECVSIPLPSAECVSQDKSFVPFELSIEDTERSSSWVWNSLATPIGFRSYSNLLIPFVCHEAFDIASSVYAITFGSDASFPTTWFDFKLDTLYLDFGWNYRTQYDFKDIHDLVKVENLALFLPEYHADATQSYDDIKDAMESFVCDTLLPVFKSLKTLSFVLKRHDPGETNNLVLDPKVYDLDHSIAFYSRPFDHSLIKEHHELRAHLDIIIPHGKDIARRIIAKNGPSYELPEISLGVVTTTARKEARDNAYNSWMLQRMSYNTPPLEYRFVIYCYEANTPRDMLPELLTTLGNVMIKSCRKHQSMSLSPSFENIGAYQTPPISY